MVWPGGKDGSGVVQRLINQIPPHDVFVSAFLGDCAIARKKRAAAATIGIDRDQANIARWIEERPIEGLRLFCCCGIEWLRHQFGFYQVRPLESAAVDRGRCWSHRSFRGSAVAELATSWGVSRPGPLFSTALAGSCSDAECRGGDVAGLRWFVYVDPPYLLESRRSKKAIYAQELDEDGHGRLLETVLALPCQVMVSHYPHPMYDQALAGWRSFTYRALTRGGKMATEKVWCNYPEPLELHDSRFVGGEKRERERVRRRVKNWLNGLERMPRLERQAILDSLEGRGFRRRDPATLVSAALPAVGLAAAAAEVGGAGPAQKTGAASRKKNRPRRSPGKRRSRSGE